MNARTNIASATRMLGLLLLFAALAGLPAVAQPAWKADPARSSEGEVEITLTPRDVTRGRFRVDAVFTTHSGDLSALNLREAVELRVEGQVLRPVSAPSLRGHHLRGRLEFALEAVPDAFEIVIRGVPSVGDVTFRWP